MLVGDGVEDFVLGLGWGVEELGGGGEGVGVAFRVVVGFGGDGGWVGVLGGVLVCWFCFCCCLACGRS